MTTTLIEQLVAQSPVITDGAWGTLLQARGLTQGTCPDEWNLTHPEIVEEVARVYVEAGSRIILTNTFRSNPLALAGYGLADKAAEINHAGAEIARRASGGRAYVFASIGPSGKMLLQGDVTEEEMREAFQVQAVALAAAGVDALVLETMGDLAEADLAIDAARTTGLPVVACMVFDSGKDYDCTMMGVSPELAAQHLTAAGADVIGANCGQGIGGYIQICERMRKSTDRPLWMKPNAGIPVVVDDAVVYQTTPEQFARDASRLVEAGAAFVGGCCGTGPNFIQTLAQTFSS